MSDKKPEFAKEAEDSRLDALETSVKLLQKEYSDLAVEVGNLAIFVKEFRAERSQ